MRTTTADGALQSRLTKKLVGGGIGPGDDVVLPSYGGREALSAVRAVGATAVFADIEVDTFCLDPIAVADVITQRTAAVVLLHTFGYPAETADLRVLAQTHGLLLVAQAPEQGPRVAQVARRRAHAAYLTSRLTGVVTPGGAGEAEHTYEQYVVRVPGNGRPDRDAFKHALLSRRIRCHVPEQIPAHWALGYHGTERLPQTERAVAECLALPAGADMSQRELERVVAACEALGGLVWAPAGRA